jgi:hypothetical protein
MQAMISNALFLKSQAKEGCKGAKDKAREMARSVLILAAV